MQNKFYAENKFQTSVTKFILKEKLLQCGNKSCAEESFKQYHYRLTNYY